MHRRRRSTAGESVWERRIDAAAAYRLLCRPASMPATTAISRSGFQPLKLGSYRMQSHAFEINCDRFENAAQRVPNHLASPCAQSI